MSLAGAIADARKSATRMYINNFADKGRQNTIDMLLGRLVEQRPVYLYDPVNDLVNYELRERSHSRQPDIVAVGFQEIVELSPQQIMSTDPSRRQVWEQAVRLAINSRMRGSTEEEYVLLRSGQLVGAALLIFVRSSALRKIKNVEGSVKKTGMSGMAGNKGAVAIRMEYANTRICLVTAHLAAGFANYEQRNIDYHTISHGLRFQRNRTIDDHDTVIWLGDFNYRIGLSDDKVRRLIQAGDLGTLYQNDQLNLQMIAGRVFPFYAESPITFMPTYKYDNGTDKYDTSEKARIPAWCDRILRKGNNLKQIDYATAPLRFSDHRPVYATFRCTVESIDEQRKGDLSQILYERRKPNATLARADDDEKAHEDHAGYVSVADGLPPASSDRRKWWLDHGLAARSQIQPPQNNARLNPIRPSNPFAAAHEPDWIMVERSEEPEGPVNRIGNLPMVPPSRGSRVSLRPPDPKPGTSHLSSVQVSSKDELASPSLPSPRRFSTGSRKPAPPVPEKPTSLSKSGAGFIGPTMNALGRFPTEDPMKGNSSNTPFPSLSARKGSGPTASQSGQPPPRPGNKGRRPPPPAASQSRTLSVSRGDGEKDSPQGNLLDQEDEGARTIPPLQPLRPT
ncbi:MAG: hypothetical protein Q9205_001543 [Flavoplaca limonia]